MSGGFFDYIQGRLKYDVIEPLKQVIDRQGKEKDKEDLYMQRDYYEKYRFNRPARQRQDHAGPLSGRDAAKRLYRRGPGD